MFSTFFLLVCSVCPLFRSTHFLKQSLQKGERTEERKREGKTDRQNGARKESKRKVVEGEKETYAATEETFGHGV